MVVSALVRPSSLSSAVGPASRSASCCCGVPVTAPGGGPGPAGRRGSGRAGPPTMPTPSGTGLLDASTRPGRSERPRRSSSGTPHPASRKRQQQNRQRRLMRRTRAGRRGSGRRRPAGRDRGRAAVGGGVLGDEGQAEPGAVAVRRGRSPAGPRTNRSKISGLSSRATPGPSSSTSMRPTSRRSARRTAIGPPPYACALSSRLPSSCSTRRRSTLPGRRAPARTTIAVRHPAVAADLTGQLGHVDRRAGGRPVAAGRARAGR